MADTIIYGGYLIIDAETVIPHGGLLIRGSKIVETGFYNDLRTRYPGVETLGGEAFLVMPGFINAHSHGKGLTDFQRGQVDDTLETWKWRAFPRIDEYQDTLYFNLLCLRAGITTTMVNHNIQRPEDPEEECVQILEAFRTSGMRVCFSPVLAEKNIFVYGDNTAFLKGLPPDLRTLAETITARSALFGLREYLNLHETLRHRADGDTISLFHGPLAPQWVEDPSLNVLAEDAQKRNMPLHIHTQQTRLQNLYGYKAYGHSLIRHLHELGVLNAQVTCGHCVWISEDDMDLLAETGTSVTHHPACNLRIRNGIAPVDRLTEKGVSVAIGMDDKDMNDRRCYLEDLRLASRLHRVNSCRLDSPILGSRDFFRMATENGAQVLGKHDELGRLRPGMSADLLLVNLETMTGPFSFPDHDIFDLLLYRGRSEDIDTVMVRGDILYQRGNYTRLDAEAVTKSLIASIPRDYAEQFIRMNEPMKKVRPHITGYYEKWYEELDRQPMAPFYAMNGFIPRLDKKKGVS